MLADANNTFLCSQVVQTHVLFKQMDIIGADMFGDITQPLLLGGNAFHVPALPASNAVPITTDDWIPVAGENITRIILCHVNLRVYWKKQKQGPFGPCFLDQLPAKLQR